MTIAIVAAFCLLASVAYPQHPAWSAFANNNGHTAASPASPQPFTRFHWTATVDLAPPLMGGALPIHYASPLITAANTVLVPVRTSAGSTFRIRAYNGLTGAELWSETSGYAPPPSDWVPPFPAALTPQNKLVTADAGGTVIVRTNPDAGTGETSRHAFYGLTNWKAFRGAYDAAVAISTPITVDSAGNVFFGFTVSGATPINLVSGLARLGADGSAAWVSAAVAANDPTVIGVAQNCAPALSADGSTLYVAVTDGNGGSLLALDAATLALKAQAKLIDPVTGQPADIDSDSTASPTVAPDGDVYFGVLESDDPQHDNRGWLLHFNGTLAQLKTPGSFGWDTTASLVPTSAVQGYESKSPYLIVTKYNNYFGVGMLGDGRNRIALLDPTRTQKDRYSAATVMREVKTILEPIHQPGNPSYARYEWCINSAVVDGRTGTVIANSEDGKVYAWDLSSNRLTQSLRLNAPRLEAYTPTVIGPDGTVYAINNSKLYAIGQ
jgi:hypothetical protein